MVENRPIIDFSGFKTTIKEINMSVSCPECGSNNFDSHKKGFSVKQAIAGGVLFGPVGLLGGAIGKNKIKVHCLSCGHSWDLVQLSKARQKEKTKQDEEDDGQSTALFFLFFTLLIGTFVIKHNYGWAIVFLTYLLSAAIFAGVFWLDKEFYIASIIMVISFFGIIAIIITGFVTGWGETIWFSFMYSIIICSSALFRV